MPALEEKIISDLAAVLADNKVYIRDMDQWDDIKGCITDVDRMVYVDGVYLPRVTIMSLINAAIQKSNPQSQSTMYSDEE